MALPTTLTLEIVTPERVIAHDEVDEIQIPGSQGYLGVLPGHTSLLTTLQVGEAWYRRGDEITYLAVAFGFAEVLPDRVTILAQIAERAEDIDRDRAEAARKRAHERIDRSVVDMDFERARIALMKSMIRLHVASKIRVRPRARL